MSGIENGAVERRVLGLENQVQRIENQVQRIESSGSVSTTGSNERVALTPLAPRTLGRFRALVVPRALVGSGNLMGSRMIIIPRAVVLPRVFVALPALAVRALVVPRSLTSEIVDDDPDYVIGRVR